MRISVPLGRPGLQPLAEAGRTTWPVRRLSAIRPTLAPRGWLLVPFIGAVTSRAWSTVLLEVASRIDHVPLIGSTGTFARWDARWYLAIAVNGYHRVPLHENALGGQHDYAFFPLWPLVIRAASVVGLPPAEVAAVLAAALFCVAAVLVAAVLEPAFGRLVATDATLLLAFSPAGWIFSMGYTESLFLALAALSFLLRRPGLRAAAVAAAVLTRVAGLPLVAVEALRVVASRGRDRGAAMTAIAGAIAFGGWWVAVAVISSDPLGFLHGSPDWVVTSGLTEVVGVLARPEPRLIGQLAFYAAAVGGSLVAWRRSRQLGTFALLALALGLLPGGLVSSMPRYALSAFPAFAGLVALAGRRWAPVLIAVSALAQVALVAASFAPIHPLAP